MCEPGDHWCITIPSPVVLKAWPWGSSIFTTWGCVQNADSESETVECALAVGNLWCWGSLEIGGLLMRRAGLKDTEKSVFLFSAWVMPLIWMSGSNTWVEIIAFAFPPIFAFRFSFCLRMILVCSHGQSGAHPNAIRTNMTTREGSSRQPCTCLGISWVEHWRSHIPKNPYILSEWSIPYPCDTLRAANYGFYNLFMPLLIPVHILWPSSWSSFWLRISHPL